MSGLTPFIPAPANSIETVLRPALVEALPQGARMLSMNILTAEAVLFDVMKRCLPTESYLKLG
eukprot:2180242-Amphidinium_carterae.1